MNHQRLLDDFCHMVTIESLSRHEGRMAAFCREHLESLGFSVRMDDSGPQTGSEVGNLIAFRPGERRGHLAFAAHMDTVEPCEGIVPVVEDGVIRSAGDTILSADDKAGIACIFEAIASFQEAGEPLPDLTVVFTTCEELSLLGSGAIDPGFIPSNVPCFVLDADGTPGGAIVAAPSHHTIRAEFIGKASHAGVVPEEGVSAIKAAAAALMTMPLGRIDEVTTANIGMIEGGREVNIVPDHCVLHGECRSLYPQRAQEQRDAMDEALRRAAAEQGCSVQIEWRKDYDAILYEEDDPFLLQLKQAVQRAGLVWEARRTGGGADANNFAAYGLKAITLSTGMLDYHTCSESIKVEDLDSLALLCEELLRLAEQ